MSNQDTLVRPFFGKTKKIIETIHSLDEKWYVEFWEEHYYFMGIEIFVTKREKIMQNGKKKRVKE